MKDGAASLTTPRDLPAPRELALLTVLALIPIERDLTIWALPDAGDEFDLRVGVSAFHFPLVVLVVLSLGELIRSPRRPTTAFAPLIAASVGWLAVSFAVNPSVRGVDVLAHFVAGWAIWDTIRSGDEAARRRVLAAVCLLGVFEAMLAFAQRGLGGRLGVPILEAGGAFYRVGSTIAVRGSFVHQYHFAGMVMVATATALVLLGRRPGALVHRLVIAALLVLGAVLPMTFSRAVVLAVVPMLIVLGLCLRRRLPLATPAWATGLLIGAAISYDGIASRASRTVSGEPRSIGTGRMDRIREGIDLARAHPFTGVGPGNYVAELRSRLGPDPLEVLPPHNFVVHFMAEAGLVGGVLAAALIGALAVWAVQGGALRVVVVLAMGPFLVLDLFSYTRQTGILMSAIWLAAAHIAGDRPPDEPDRASASCAPGETSDSQGPLPDRR